MEEVEFRKLVQESFDIVERAFENVDPDLAECEQSLGSMTITFGDGNRCILSMQPSVRQLWMAVAHKGIAFHFNFESGRWIDDKGKGVELLSYLKTVLKEMTKLEFAFGQGSASGH